MGRLYLVNNYVDIPDKEKINKGGDGESIIFVGKMDYEPNVLAVDFFVNRIFKNISIDYPQIKFLIIGSRPNTKVRNLSSDKVIITGFVDSIESYLQNATLFVAPMLTGSGIQNKIIQAMSYGCCVLTTPIGREGLSLKDNGLTICSNINDWLFQINHLLNDREERLKKGSIARTYVQRHFSKDIVREQFRSFVSF